MNFSNTFKTLRSGNTYDSIAEQEISFHEEVKTAEIGINVNEENPENGVKFSPDMVGERIEAKVEMLHAQFSTLTELMVRFF